MSRFVLLTVLGVVWLCVATARADDADPAAAAPEIVLSTGGFHGENCARCHETIRDRLPGPLNAKIPPVDAGQVDVVVVGGGLSGLTAAYSLRDYRVRVLEKEGKAGGKVRRESFDGHPYPVAAVYMGKPEGRIGKMFRSLGLKAQRIDFTEHALFDGGKITYDWIKEDASQLPYSDEGREGITRMQAFLAKFDSSSGIDVPLDYVKPQKLAAYDDQAFTRYIDFEYGRDAARLADLFAKDMFGVSGEFVSAAAGLYYFSSELEPSYTWEGGLGAATEALSTSLGPSVSTGCFVWRVAQDDQGVEVDYRRADVDYRVRAKAAVIAVPSLIARRIVTNLSDEKRQAMAAVRYSSYMLAPMHIKPVQWDQSFVLWAPGRIFTDLTFPVPSPQDGDEQVLVAYAPMGESEGRRTLLNASDRELMDKVVSDLSGVLPKAPSAITEASIIRWGHAMPVLYPGYLSKVRPVLAKPEGRYFFAGVDTQIPTFEGAAYSGLLAADEARHYLSSHR